MATSVDFSASPRLRAEFSRLNVDVALTSRATGVPVKQATLSDTDRRGNKFKPTDWGSRGAWRRDAFATINGEPRPGKKGISPGEVQNSRGICRGDNRESTNPTFSDCATQLRLKPRHLI
jgi:hypothetical protein